MKHIIGKNMQKYILVRGVNPVFQTLLINSLFYFYDNKLQSSEKNVTHF